MRRCYFENIHYTPLRLYFNLFKNLIKISYQELRQDLKVELEVELEANKEVERNSETINPSGLKIKVFRENTFMRTEIRTFFKKYLFYRNIGYIFRSN